MRSAMFMPLACLMLQAADPWAEAQATLAGQLQGREGVGAVVMVERLDKQTLRIWIKCQGDAFTEVNVQPVNQPPYEARFLFNGHGASSAEGGKDRSASELRTVTAIPPGAEVMRVVIRGERFTPTLLIPIPGVGEPASGHVVTMGSSAR